MPTPPAKNSAVPYDCIWCRPPYGPSTKQRVRSLPSVESAAMRQSLAVMPVRPRMTNDMLVLRIDSTSWRCMASLSESSDSASSLQATEKGCDCQKLMEGMYRYACWPGLKVHGRAMVTVTRQALPGRASTSVWVPPLPTLTHRSRRTERRGPQSRWL